MMQVGPRTVVTVEYVLTDDDGEVLDSTEGQEPLDYLHGIGQIVPGLEQALTGKTDGDTIQVIIAPEEAYGEHDPELVHAVPRSEFESIDDLEVGMQLELEGPDGTQVVNVIEIAPDAVILDANHPLAGVTLHFDVKILSVRDATLEEITHGHPHGPGGQHHH